jgi:beta-glucosidase
MLGTWAVSGNSDLAIPVLDGMKNTGGEGVKILYAKGANISDDPDFAKKINVFGTRIEIDKRSPEEMIEEAVTAAIQSDVTVAVVGEASEMSGESSSRSDITIPGSQKKLIEALYKTGKPLVLVIMAGRPLAVGWEMQHAASVVYMYHGGQQAGNALADVLFGDYNPSGKLTNTFPRNVGQIPVYYNHLNTGRPNNGDVFQKFLSNYLDVENSPLFPFGYGLSYTTFKYSGIKLSATSLNAAGKITATVTVTNTGNFDGEEVVQMYIRDMVGSISRPVKELKGFQKIMFKKGESKDVSFTIGIEDLKFYNRELKRVAEPGDFKIMIGGNSQELNEADFKLIK